MYKVKAKLNEFEYIKESAHEASSKKVRGEGGNIQQE